MERDDSAYHRRRAVWSVPAGYDRSGGGANRRGMNIPTLCYLKDINEIGACRLCVVDYGRAARCRPPACCPWRPRAWWSRPTPPPCARRASMNLELILSNHDKKCLSPACAARTASCKSCAWIWAWKDGDRFAGPRISMKRMTSLRLHRAQQQQVRAVPPLRGRLRKCPEAWASSARCSRGFNTAIDSPWDDDAGRHGLHQLRPVYRRLPHGRADRNATTPQEVWKRAGRSRTSMWWCSPRPPCAPRWARNSACPWAPACTGKMAAALRRLGFDKVFDTDFGADLTIMEEGTELHRPHQERRRAAHDYLLLSRLDQATASTIIRISCPICPPASRPTR